MQFEKIQVFLQPIEAMKVPLYTGKVVVHYTDMTKEMQGDAINCAVKAIRYNKINRKSSEHIMDYFNKKYNSTWKCTVRRSFINESVIHHKINVIFFFVGAIGVLLFKEN